MLVIADRYLTSGDRRRIVESDDPLKTAVEIARVCIDAYGTDQEVSWLARHTETPPEPAPRSESTSQSRTKEPPAPHQRGKPRATAAGEREGPVRDDSHPGNVRSLLDHMFEPA